MATPINQLRALLAARLVEDCHAIAEALLASNAVDRVLIEPQTRDGSGCLLMRVGLGHGYVTADLVVYPGSPRRQILDDLLLEIGEASNPKESGS